MIIMPSIHSKILRTLHRCSHIITTQKHTRVRALTNTYTDARAPTQARTHADADLQAVATQNAKESQHISREDETESDTACRLEQMGLESRSGSRSRIRVM